MVGVGQGWEPPALVLAEAAGDILHLPPAERPPAPAMALPSIQLSDVRRDEPSQAERQHPAQPGVNKIVVYEHVDFEGLSREFTSDVPDLHELDFGDCICSLRVVGQPWIAYTAPKYEGDAYALEEGEYRTVEKNKAFSALRLVHHDLADPQITLYEEPNYAGQSKVVTEETNLTYGYFNDRVSSHVVQRGVWLLYKHPDRGGWYHIAWPGERLPDYKPELGFHNCLSHLLGRRWGGSREVGGAGQWLPSRQCR
uniref:Beta/gamma crystallin 'Greek key' domain-containing protein n=1 Tax=Terrapene triunguis TaxID=2587831 RepID=A0A674ID78_9SAUR